MRAKRAEAVAKRMFSASLVALAACGPITGGRLLADPAVLDAIRRYYDAHALEDPACGEPFITRLQRASAHPLAVMGAPTQVVVDYRWEAPARAAGGSPCTGEGRRSFWVLSTSGGPKVTAMSGPSRATRSAP